LDSPIGSSYMEAIWALYLCGIMSVFNTLYIEQLIQTVDVMCGFYVYTGAT